MSRVGVIDYGCGNIQSIMNAFATLGAKVELVSEPDDVDGYDHLVLPGVGAFELAIKRLRDCYFVEALDHKKAKGTPILGICLGMQLLCTDSDEVLSSVAPSEAESRLVSGLGWIDAKVRHFRSIGVTELKVPHMGWNELLPQEQSPLFDGLAERPDVYFVHSHAVNVESDKDKIAGTIYGVEFSSAIQNENVIGLQFHPEKSHKVGLKILENFLEL